MTLRASLLDDVTGERVHVADPAVAVIVTAQGRVHTFTPPTPLAARQAAGHLEHVAAELRRIAHAGVA